MFGSWNFGSFCWRMEKREDSKAKPQTINAMPLALLFCHKIYYNWIVTPQPHKEGYLYLYLSFISLFNPSSSYSLVKWEKRNKMSFASMIIITLICSLLQEPKPMYIYIWILGFLAFFLSNYCSNQSFFKKKKNKFLEL